MELARFIESVISESLTNPESNNLGPDCGDRAWDGFLLGFSRGDDELYEFLKEHIGDLHWTPAEAFALGLTAERASADELTVVSWALSQTERTKAANRAQNRFPSEPWARSRLYGQRHQRSLQRSLVQALTVRGYATVAPGLLPEFAERESPTHGRASTWSERHVAYISGLGTFGLCGGLITERGQAVRLGSLIVRAKIPPTVRPYSDPFAYCLFFQHGSCGECAERCPAGSVGEESRDKEACAHQLQPVSADYVKREYGFDGYGCGLCQTGVPCESGIPSALRRGTTP